MCASFSPRDGDLPPRFADVSAVAHAPEANTTGAGRVQPVVRDAYVHWHDPDTVTIHPFKDTPLGDAA